MASPPSPSPLPLPLTLPIIDLSPLSDDSASPETLKALSDALSTAFSTTGFAYLINNPLSFTHEDIFTITRDFFELPHERKMKVARKTFRNGNSNTYRGYFPVQAGGGNVKEGFEIGGMRDGKGQGRRGPGVFDLEEGNVWPEGWKGRGGMERLRRELQGLAEKLLGLLAVALGKSGDYFEGYMKGSLSTLRLLHYPAVAASLSKQTRRQELCCTPHTDSGILTLLHQDATGGLEVLGMDDEWIPAPCVPDSIVVNIGDLMSRVSGGKFKATVHRVRSSPGKERFSVPFFFEPGAECVVKSAVDAGHVGIRYGTHILEKMGGWIEFRDVALDERGFEVGGGEIMVEA